MMKEKHEVVPLQPSIQNFPEMPGGDKKKNKNSTNNAKPAKVYMPMNQAKFQPFAYRQQQIR